MLKYNPNKQKTRVITPFRVHTHTGREGRREGCDMRRTYPSCSSRQEGGRRRLGGGELSQCTRDRKEGRE
jgi:hypothetical protein